VSLRSAAGRVITPVRHWIHRWNDVGGDLRTARRTAREHGCGFRYLVGRNLHQLEFLDGALRGFRLLLPGLEVGPDGGPGKRFHYFVHCAEELPGYFHIPPAANATVLDLGGFPGDFAVAASHVAHAGRIVACEPDPQNRREMLDILRLNDTRVELLPYAISDSDGEARFAPNLHEGKLASCGPLTVKTRTLDTICREIGIDTSRPVFVKMDIEGAEIPAMEHAGLLFEMEATFAIAAYHRVDDDRTAEWLEPFFSARGYRTERINEDRHLTLIAAPG